jgi:putative hydrolase of HD superfamily
MTAGAGTVSRLMLHTLIELQRLKGLDRTGWTLRGHRPGTESVAEHTFGVAVTAMLLADELRARGVGVDVERVLRMSLVHDWAETRVGDMPKTAVEYFGAENRKRAETAAFADIVAENRSLQEYCAVYADYEERRSLEARLVKAADVIDLLVQALALERAGARGLDEFWQAAENNFGLEAEAAEVTTDMLQALVAEREKIRSKR